MPAVPREPHARSHRSRRSRQPPRKHAGGADSDKSSLESFRSTRRSGLTIEDRGYNGDYGTPLWGDYAIVKVKAGAAVPEMMTAGLFDENWQLPK